MTNSEIIDELTEYNTKGMSVMELIDYVFELEFCIFGRLRKEHKNHLRDSLLLDPSINHLNKDMKIFFIRAYLLGCLAYTEKFRTLDKILTNSEDLRKRTRRYKEEL